MKSIEERLIMYVAIVALLALCVGMATTAWAGGSKPTQQQGQGQEQTARQDVTVNIGGDGQPLMQDADTTSLETGDTTLQGGDTTFNSSNESSNVVLVPNNNTENCLRVWGLSWGNSSGAGGIGYPHRSAPCDYEQAADDAGALGDHRLAWYWRCHKSNVNKPFREKRGWFAGRENTEAAIRACFEKMGGFLDVGTMQQRIDTLEEQKATLLEERDHDRATCEESKDRILDGCRK